MTYNERYNDGEDDDDIVTEIDQPAESYAFHWLDIPGALLFATGQALKAFGSGLEDLGDVLRINAWNDRTLKALADELERDRATFDTIITDPSLYREESP